PSRARSRALLGGSARDRSRLHRADASGRRRRDRRQHRGIRVHRAGRIRARRRAAGVHGAASAADARSERIAASALSAPGSSMAVKGFTQKEYAARRARLMQAIGAGGIAIVPAAREVVRSRDTHYRFRQDSDFAYLTGFPEPDAVAVLAPGRRDGGRKAEYLLFVRNRDPEREIWDGRRAGPAGAVRDYGAHEAYPIEEFEAHLPALL